jgi:cytidine deaminase
MADRKLFKCAFYGLPGAGKSTSMQMIIEKARQSGFWIGCIKFAEPLYQAQAEIYRLAGRPLAEKTKQDGRLLNFLGGHFREINRNSLTEYFSLTEALHTRQFENQSLSKGLLLNDDMRATETVFLKTQGFHLTHIMADPTTCHSRRKLRGDLTLGSDKDSTEAGINTIVPDATIINNGSLADLDDRITEFLNQIIK